MKRLLKKNRRRNYDISPHSFESEENQTCLKGKQGSCLKIFSEIQVFAEKLCGEIIVQVEVDNTGSNFKSQVSKTPGKEEP